MGTNPPTDGARPTPPQSEGPLKQSPPPLPKRPTDRGISTLHQPLSAIPNSLEVSPAGLAMSAQAQILSENGIPGPSPSKINQAEMRKQVWRELNQFLENYRAESANNNNRHQPTVLPDTRPPEAHTSPPLQPILLSPVLQFQNSMQNIDPVETIKQHDATIREIVQKGIEAIVRNENSQTTTTASNLEDLEKYPEAIKAELVKAVEPIQQRKALFEQAMAAVIDQLKMINPRIPPLLSELSQMGNATDVERMRVINELRAIALAKGKGALLLGLIPDVQAVYDATQKLWVWENTAVKGWPNMKKILDHDFRIRLPIEVFKAATFEEGTAQLTLNRRKHDINRQMPPIYLEMATPQIHHTSSDAKRNWWEQELRRADETFQEMVALYRVVWDYLESIKQLKEQAKHNLPLVQQLWELHRYLYDVKLNAKTNFKP
ncbi:hypothetical protein H4R33_002155 [Dimargaris cristalligena]|nr:hypothetical protein H4R33_002155 [Dimargaris cristalligena]